jgi:hypothetical protein
VLVSGDSLFKLKSPLTLDDAVNPLVGLDGDDALVLTNVLHDVVDAAYTVYIHVKCNIEQKYLKKTRLLCRP